MSEGILRQLIIDEKDGKVNACTLENGRLIEMLSGSAEEPQISGSIYLGRVVRLVPGMDAAFIDIGLNRTAILSGSEMKREVPTCGQEFMVQVTKLPGGDKGPVVSRKLKLAARMCVLLTEDDTVNVSRKIEDRKESERLKATALKYKPDHMGLIIRTAAAYAKDEELRKDIETLKNEYCALAEQANFYGMRQLRWGRFASAWATLNAATGIRRRKAGYARMPVPFRQIIGYADWLLHSALKKGRNAGRKIKRLLATK